MWQVLSFILTMAPDINSWPSVGKLIDLYLYTRPKRNDVGWMDFQGIIEKLNTWFGGVICKEKNNPGSAARIVNWILGRQEVCELTIVGYTTIATICVMCITILAIALVSIVVRCYFRKGKGERAVTKDSSYINIVEPETTRPEETTSEVFQSAGLETSHETEVEVANAVAQEITQSEAQSEAQSLAHSQENQPNELHDNRERTSNEANSVIQIIPVNHLKKSIVKPTKIILLRSYLDTRWKNRFKDNFS